ncbi:MAG: hypothetical protein ABEL76_15940 [Bradymonadaceae bacterium]
MIPDARTSRLAATAVVAGFWLLAAPSVAAAGGNNNLQLSRFAYFKQTPGKCGGKAYPCGTAVRNDKLFRRLVHDFGQVMASPMLSPAETLGQAGFAVNVVPQLTFIPSDEKHWKRAVSQNRRVPASSDKPVEKMQGGGPAPVMFKPNIMVRKGLPFSLEIAGTMSHIAGSDMFTVGSQFKWALNEGFELFPAVAVRGTVDTLVGSKDLEMVTAGWDVSVSKAFALGGVLSLTPYAGYQQLHAIGWSRLLNARPQDPRAPQQYGKNGSRTFNPEFVFPAHHVAINRGFLGLRMHTWIFDFTAEGMIGENVHSLSLGAGLDF